MAVPSQWGMWSDQCLEVDRCGSADGLEGQHHHLEADAGLNRKPMEVTEDGGHVGELIDIPLTQHRDVFKMVKMCSFTFGR